MTIKQLISWLAVIFWMGVIFWLSHQPGGESSGLSSGIAAQAFSIISWIVPESILDFDTFHTMIRKSAHFIAYFTLGILLMNALGRSGIFGFRRMMIAFFLSVLYAISDEIHQLYIPGRSGEVRDVLIDSGGAAMGIALFLLVGLFLKKRRVTET